MKKTLWHNAVKLPLKEYRKLMALKKVVKEFEASLPLKVVDALKKLEEK
jgi:hypothetical protein